MGKFRIIPSIYLYNGNVVDKETMEIVGDGDAVDLPLCYNNRGADELLVFDYIFIRQWTWCTISVQWLRLQDAVDIPDDCWRKC